VRQKGDWGLAPGTRDVMGVAVLVATTDEAIAHLEAEHAAGRRRSVAFLNAHTSNLAAADETFTRALADFTVLNDGVGVDVASRWLHGEAFPENLNGTDFLPAYLRAIRDPLRIYLLGGRPGVAAAAGEKLLALAPHHEVVGARHGYYDPADVEAVIADIVEVRPDILLVAFGNPQQEQFLAQYAEALDVPLAFGVGALLDFLAGRVERAPVWVRRLRAEWVWRLLVEPRRMWRRYLVGNVTFLLRALRTPRPR
jgi:exopolysaccharide biosynthesis WecB/TagA/CpsF family protein